MELGDFATYSTSSLTFSLANLVGSRVYVFAASLPFSAYFDTIAMKWVQLGPIPHKFSECSSVLVDDVIMSCTLDEARISSVWVFDQILDEWTPHYIDYPENVIPHRAMLEYVDFARMIVVFGGYIYNGQSHPTPVETNNSLVRIDVDTLEAYVPQASGSPCPPRNGHASCVLMTGKEATIFIYGGQASNGPKNDLYLLHFRQNRFRWSNGALSSFGIPCSAPSLTFVAGTLILYGGFNSNYADTNGLAIYELESNEWHVVTKRRKSGDDHNEAKYQIDELPGESSTHRTFLTSKGLLVVGGFGRKFPWISILSGSD